MTSFTSSDLKSLAGLLNMDADVDSEDDCFECNSVKSNSNLNVMAQDIKASQTDKKYKDDYYSKIVKSSKNIWDDDEILNEEEDEAKTKDKPEYELLYQQTVTTDDIFLQLSGKGPGSDSCDCFVIKIKLPGIHSKEEVNLNISTLKLICKTKKYYLNLDLAKQVDPVKCSAKWDQSQNLLVVKLPFDPECKLNL